MNQELIRIMNEMDDDFLSADAEFIKRLASMSIPGLVTFDGEDITDDILNKKNFKSFYSKNVGRFGYNQEALCQYINDLNAEKQVDQLKDVLKRFELINNTPEQTGQTLQYIHSAIRKIISLINDLIPIEVKERDKLAVETILFCTERLKYSFDSSEHFFNESLNVLLPGNSELDKDKQAILDRFSRASSLFLLKFTPFYCRNIMLVMFLYQISCGYFSRSEDDKNTNVISVGLLNQIRSLIAAEIQPTRDEIKEIKVIQKETNKLIENRNDNEIPKRRPRANCAKDICRILRNEYKTPVQQDTIDKYLYRREQQLNKGEKIDIPTYEQAMYFDQKGFIVWIRETFIPHYLEHRKVRSKKIKPRYSSSDAALDEAALQEYKNKKR